ncbi:mitochondrial protein Pet127-domain-containing protein [Phyllosticta citriasiana]|uniref:Mitochondrial protein Pet127-domain-containing protein n=1 Tax=Phyllosticta citriasiana TaxID=595635 RepID=A0ABR1KZM7_9PEZI
MLGRSSARVLRSAPQHICLPCLRRQLLQPIAARSPSLATFRRALLHTTAAARDQLQSENAVSPSPPAADHDGTGTGSKTNATNSLRRRGPCSKRAAKEESASDNPQQEEDQDKDLDNKTFAAGQLENHSSLSEALTNPVEGIKIPIRRTRTNGGRHRSTGAAHRSGKPSAAAALSLKERKSKARDKTASRKASAANASSSEKNAEKAQEQTQKSKKTSRKSPLKAPDVLLAYESLSAQELQLTPVDVNQPSVPVLAYGLDRVLFNPGVYHLQDPRTQVFNFDPYLSNIMPVAEFNFNSLGEYITSSRDTALSDLAREHQKTFVGSTSSMTSSLAHFHYLLSNWRPINISTLSKAFPESLDTFTKLNRLPASIFLRYKDGVYSIDADKEFDSSNILAMLGKSLEKLLTLPKEEYERYRVSNPNQISKEERDQPESYHYTSMGDILMRSQLDAQDSRLPGTGMYDLKTRAVVSIRMDVDSWDKNTGYQIKQDLGKFESYEREYYDMMRSMMLKYSLQARMGRMDGIFVAYHNIERIFGFQYISLEEMDRGLHGTTEGRHVGDQEFRLSVGLLNKVLREAIQKFPETSLRIHFETRDSQTSPWMYIFAEPMSEDEVQAIQDTNKAKIQAFERRVLGLDSGNGEDAEEAAEQDAAMSDGSFEEGVGSTPVVESNVHREEESDADGEAIFEEVEGSTASEEVQDDAVSESATSEPTAEDEMALAWLAGATQDGISVDGIKLPDFDADGEVIVGSAAQEDVSESQETRDDVDATSNASEGGSSRPLFGLRLSIINTVDGKRVVRPSNLDEKSDWTVHYSIQELSRQKAEANYKACRKRRAAGFAMSAKEVKGDKVLSYYQRFLRNLSDKGRVWRGDRDQELEQRGKVVFKSRASSHEPRRLDGVDTYLSWLYNRGPEKRDD